MPVAAALFFGWVGAATPAHAQEDDWDDEKALPVEIHGFAEAAVGVRVTEDPIQPGDFVLNEARFRLDVSRYSDRADVVFKGDLLADGLSRDVEIDIRQALVTLHAAEWLDVRAGRQILTWGTGDLVFINDRFPKDFLSFFIGRDDEFLKAPSNTARFTFYSNLIDLDLVWTPTFTPDRAITGQRLSFFDPRAGALVSATTQGGPVDPLPPPQKLENGEFAGRLFRTVAGYELNLYGYIGFTKQAFAFDTAANTPAYSRLDAYGASARGNAFGGIANLEGAFYYSVDDKNGTDPNVPNSELRALGGYERELAANLTAGVQYYLQSIQDYDALVANSPTPEFEPPQAKHTFTLRLTYLLSQQTIVLSMFTFYSPSSKDAYLRPIVEYDWSDDVTITAGANILLGPDPSFFGQLENNSNAYARLQYSF